MLKRSGSDSNANLFLYTKAKKLFVAKYKLLLGISPETRANISIAQLKRNQWKMNKRSRSLPRSPSQARAIGLSYTVDEDLFRGKDHNVYRYNLEGLRPRRSKKKSHK